MAVNSIRVFSAANLTNAAGGQAINFGDTDGFLLGSGPFSIGSDTGVLARIDDTDVGAGGDTAPFFDDGTSAAQELDSALTLTHAGPSGQVTTTFPPGTQIQAEFTVSFSSGHSIIGIRLENPNAPPALITAGYAVFDASGAPVIPSAGTNLGSVTSRSGNGETPYADIACFTKGTLIDTPEGTRRVEALKIGDLVLTYDDGAQPVTWVGAVTVPKVATAIAPVQIAAGVFGNDRPLRVSPNHRMLVTGHAPQLLFGLEEVLVPAKALLALPGVSQMSPSVPVSYVHFTCPTHQLVRANAAWTETLLSGESLFGDSTGPDREAARPILRMYEARVLAQVLARSHRSEQGVGRRAA